MNDKLSMDISISTLLKIAGLIVGIWLLFLVREIVLLFFIVVIIVSALSPIVDRWHKIGIPRILAVLIIYLVILGVLGLIGWLILPPLIVQIQELAFDLPYRLGRFVPLIQSWREMINISQQSLTTIAQSLGKISTSVYSTTLGFFSVIVAVVTVFVSSFYLLLEEQSAKNLLVSLFPLDHKTRLIEVANKIGFKLGAWMRGQLALGLIIGLVDFTWLAILGVPYALTLAVWAGLTELIPYIGPILGAIPGVIVALTISPIKGLIALALYTGVQQLEGQLLVPQVMKKAVGLSPVTIIFAMLIGAKLMGFLGVLLAVPAAAAIVVLLQELPQLRKES